MEQTSVDMSMVPSEIDYCVDLAALVKEGTVPESRLDESAGRVLQLKENLGLLDNPMPDPNHPGLALIGSAQHRQIALDAARSSIILLENDNGALPLSASSLDQIFVVGPSSDSLTLQCGGWTVKWQGAPDDSYFAFGTTITQGIKDIVGAGVHVVQQLGVDVHGIYTEQSLAQALANAAQSDVTVFCLSETTYAERYGDISDLSLPDGQLEFLTALINAGNKVVVVITEGRPRILNDATDGAVAVVNALLPGLEGGQAIAEVLFGLVNPSARLPLSYPRNPATQPLQYFHAMTSTDDFKWEFGHGLSYSTFVYSNLQLSNDTIVAPAGTVDVSFSVYNQGPFAGAHSILVFLKDNFREVTPETKLLWTFTKVSLGVGETYNFHATVQVSDLAFYGIDENVKVIEAGTHTVLVEDLSATFTLVV